MTNHKPYHDDVCWKWTRLCDALHNNVLLASTLYCWFTSEEQHQRGYKSCGTSGTKISCYVILIASADNTAWWQMNCGEPYSTAERYRTAAFPVTYRQEQHLSKFISQVLCVLLLLHRLHQLHYSILLYCCMHEMLVEYSACVARDSHANKSLTYTMFALITCTRPWYVCIALLLRQMR